MNDSYDVLVIGGGPAGTAAALRAAELGATVAVGERVRVSGSEGAILLVEPLTLLSDESTQPAG